MLFVAEVAKFDQVFFGEGEGHEKDCGFGDLKRQSFSGGMGEDGGAKGSVWHVRLDGCWEEAKGVSDKGGQSDMMQVCGLRLE